MKATKQFYQDVGLIADPNKITKLNKKDSKFVSKKKQTPTTKYVQDLEKEANKPRKKKFKFGKEMCKELEYYIQKYGDNFEAMARDKKNIYQDSPGQIRYKIIKYNKIHKPETRAMPSPISCFVITTAKFWKSLGALSERRIVGKPQILSRLRYVNIVQRPDETEQEIHYRTQYESLQDWNNKYWAENNELFNREKAKYIKDHFGSIAEEQALSHDQLASFYREFLERNRDKHVEYNTIWYKNHIALLVSSTNAKLSRLKANLDRYHEIKKNR